MMCDLGFAVKPVLAIDTKANEDILRRRGIGKLKHIDVAYPWVQHETRSQRTASAQTGAKKTSQTQERNHSAKR